MHPHHDGAVQSVERPVSCSVLLLPGVLHAGAGECSQQRTYARSDSALLRLDTFVHVSVSWFVFGSSAVLAAGNVSLPGSWQTDDIIHSVQH